MPTVRKPPQSGAETGPSAVSGLRSAIKLAQRTEAPAAVSPAGKPAIFEHGSVWVRADFHMHTLADKEFAYTGDHYCPKQQLL